jgi:hypothetical protein
LKSQIFNLLFLFSALSLRPLRLCGESYSLYTQLNFSKVIMKRPKAIIPCLALLMLLAGCAQKVKDEVSNGESNTLKPVRVSAENTDAAEPTVAMAQDGTAYVAWVEHRENREADVMLAHLDNEAKMKVEPVRVNPQAGMATAWRGDPPTVAVAPDETIYVGWTARSVGEGRGNDLYLSASRDGGRSFEPPVKVNDDGKQVAHGMHSLAVSADGRVYVAWLDERNVAKSSPGNQGGAMQKMEHMENNREVFITFSTDGGRSFSKNQRIAKDACPCCKTALITAERGRVFASWRQVLPGDFRHIAVAASEDGGRTFQAPVIVHDDRWMIAACPVSGPALSVSDGGALRVVWYTEGERNMPGLYWAESRDDGRTFSESRSVAKGQARGIPLLLANGKGGAFVIWESSEGNSSRVMEVPLDNYGQAASSAAPIASGGELPSAAMSGEQLFVGYIAKAGERRSIWVVRTKPIA